MAVRNDLISVLRRLAPTGPQGFEGLVARLLEHLTGRRFFLARSGPQGGRDISSDSQNFSVIAVECKRYGKTKELEEQNLIGGMARATQEISDLDLWVLVASRKISSQIAISLATQAHHQGIAFLSISADDGSPSSLEVLCAQGADIVLEHIEKKDSATQRSAVRRQLDEVTIGKLQQDVE
jgi:hypothetical protein